MRGRAILVLALAVAAAAGPVAALTNDVLTNGRRLADNSFLAGVVVNKNIKIPANLQAVNRNCFIDSGPHAAPIVAGGFQYVQQGVSMCCREAGTLAAQPGALSGYVCQFNDDATNQASTSHYFITQKLVAGGACLVDCYGMGGCDKCLGPLKIVCDQVCQNAGWDTGRCGFPGSTDPNRCCECANLNDAGTILSGGILQTT